MAYGSLFLVPFHREGRAQGNFASTFFRGAGVFPDPRFRRCEILGTCRCRRFRGCQRLHLPGVEGAVCCPAGVWCLLGVAKEGKLSAQRVWGIDCACSDGCDFASAVRIRYVSSHGSAYRRAGVCVDCCQARALRPRASELRRDSGEPAVEREGCSTFPVQCSFQARATGAAGGALGNRADPGLA